MKFHICVILSFLSLSILFPENSGERKWFQDKVFYEIFVRAFYDSDGNGVGDFNGIIEKLDYIESLGVSGIWLMPVFYSPSQHGYDIYDYYRVNPLYGTEEDLVRLFTEAKKRNISIILDLVINHTGRNISWFKKSELKEEPYTDYYVWSKEKPEGEWLSWTFSNKRKEWYFSSFGSGMPDLNFRNTAVREDVKKAAVYWLDKGASGFRLDAAKHIIENGPGALQTDTEETAQWWEEFSAYIHSVKPEALLIGEVWSSVEGVSKYYRSGNGLDLCFDFEGANAILKAGARGITSAVEDTINRKKGSEAPLDFFAPFISNHDTIRTMNILDSNFNKAKAAAVLLLTSPGTPFIYYGEEIGMYQKVTGRNDNAKRTVMQWSGAHYAGFSTSEHIRHEVSEYKNPFNVKSQDKKKDSLLNTYRTLIRLRSVYPQLAGGDYEFIQNTLKIPAFFKGKNKEFLVAVNPHDSPVTLPLAGLNGSYVNAVNGKTYRIKENIRLAPGEVLILKNM